MLNVPVDAPAFTVTEGGAASAGGALSVRFTTAPPACAAPESVTVHSVLWFEESVDNVQERAVTPAGASSDTVVEAVLPFSVAVSVAV